MNRAQVTIDLILLALLITVIWLGMAFVLGKMGWGA